MAIGRERILIVDIEATCWQEKPPPGQRSEIIEIGFCLLHLDDLRLDGKGSLLIQPVESNVSPFCQRLTSISPAMLQQQAMDFASACQALVTEITARQMLWASWGSYDRRLFRKQCRRRRVSYPFGKKHLNLRRLFAEVHACKPQSLSWALALEKLEFAGQQHRGADDAWNVARLLRLLLQRHGSAILEGYW